MNKIREQIRIIHVFVWTQSQKCSSEGHPRTPPGLLRGEAHAGQDNRQRLGRETRPRRGQTGSGGQSGHQVSALRNKMIILTVRIKFQLTKWPTCTIASKINGTRTCVYFPFFILLSILAIAILLAHSAAVNYSFSDNLTPLGVPFILLAMVHN